MTGSALPSRAGDSRSAVWRQGRRTVGAQRRSFNSVELIIILALISILLAAVLPIFRRSQVTAMRGAWQLHINAMQAQPNVVAYYPFSETKGSLLTNYASSPENVADYDPSQYFGIRRGGVNWTEGRWSGKGALYFDGINDYVDLGNYDIPPAEKQNGMTLLVWFRAHDFDHPDAPLISKSAGSTDVYWALGMTSVENTARLRATVRTADRTVRLVADTESLSTTTWYMAVCTYDGSQVRLYLNGAQVAAQPLTGGLIQDPSASVWLGDEPPTPRTQSFSGVMDEVAVFNRALTWGQIRELYQRGQH